MPLAIALLLGLAVIVVSQRGSAAPSPTPAPPPTPPGPTPSGPPTVSTLDYNKDCGPYPPLINGWRPVCVKSGKPPTSSLTLGQTVDLVIQFGKREVSDDNNLAKIEAKVLGGDPVAGYSLTYLGTSKGSNKLVVPMPPLGTTFLQVTPAYINNVVG